MAKESSIQEPLNLLLHDLDKEHPGVTAEMSGALCQAACVVLARHHSPPTSFVLSLSPQEKSCMIDWKEPDQRACNAHANANDAIESGAYALTIRTVELLMSLYAIGRAEQGSGADWYLAPQGIGVDADGVPDLDAPGVMRLEVSGQESGTIGGRVSEKKSQLLAGDSALPGIAGVVGYERAIVILAFPD